MGYASVRRQDIHFELFDLPYLEELSKLKNDFEKGRSIDTSKESLREKHARFTTILIECKAGRRIVHTGTVSLMESVTRHLAALCAEESSAETTEHEHHCLCF